MLCIVLIFSQVNSSLLYAAEVIHVTWVIPSLRNTLNYCHVTKILPDHSTFDCRCLHDLSAYCVNVGQNK